MNTYNNLNQKYDPASGNLPYVSIIIPVYNIEKYIETCILSLKRQSLKNLEFIFVDDKSTDSSMDIVRAFAASDDRVRIFYSEKNQGAGMSRNLGIENAHGEYLAFLDPDDFVSIDFYERLYNKATQGNVHDIAKGCRRKVMTNGSIIEDVSDILNERIRKRTEAGEPIYRHFSYEHTTAIFSHRLFNNDIRYGKVRSSEDVVFLFKICNMTNDIVFDSNAIYSYVQRNDSTTSIISYEKHIGGIEALGETIKWIKSKRKMNRYDYSYLSTKFATRLRTYENDMQKSPLFTKLFNKIIRLAEIQKLWNPVVNITHTSLF